MNASTDALKRARSLKYGLPIMLLVVGFLLSKNAYTYYRDHGQMAEGVVLMALGVGMLFSFRWARWLAMGGCFLVIVLCCAYPMYVIHGQPFGPFERPVHQALFYGIFVFVFGALAYKVLSYLRSEMGRQQYSAKDDAYSSGVVVSAALWGAGLWAVMNMQPAAAQKVAAAPASAAALADLEIHDLCLDGDALVMARVTNRGSGGGGEQYHLTFTNLEFRGGLGVSIGKVPMPGSTALVALDRAMHPEEEGPATLVVQTQLDPANRVPETDKRNNTRQFELHFDGYFLRGLPQCRPASIDKVIGIQ